MTLLNLMELVLLAVLVAGAAGAVAGAQLGGKDLGYGLAAMMGSFFGPTAAVPAVVVGLVALICLK
jgi:hypothetical protein